MLPSFNTAGPCIAGEHYMLAPHQRIRRVMRMIDERKYFTLHAGRQTGKTTSARWLVDHYNQGQTYRALWIDIQTARELPDVAPAMRELLTRMNDAVTRLRGLLEPPSDADLEGMLKSPTSAVLAWLRHMSAASPLPLVVMIDEADGLVGPTMVSFLTQLRTGYIDRSALPFPHALALIGMRQVRDYVLTSDDRRTLTWLGTTSPFNITAEAATLAAFSESDVGELLLQHTTQTGQVWEPDSIAKVYELSQGQPWLVNAMADQVVNRDVEDRSVAVTAEHIESAKETLIVERRSHIDSLLARLREDRVRSIVGPMLTGGRVGHDVVNDDFAYVAGLGLIALRNKVWEVANPIYREVIVRELTFVEQTQMRYDAQWYVQPDGSLDMGKLMVAWQAFWRRDGHLAAEGFRYREAGPHLMLMAFLQRVVNGGGNIAREYGLGRGALDLLIEWQGVQHAIEVKLRRDTETEADALEQVARYLDLLGLHEGWLVMFDLRKDVSWEEKLATRVVEHGGKTIRIVGS